MFFCLVYLCFVAKHNELDRISLHFGLVMIIQFSQVLRMTKLFQYLNSAEYNGFLPPLDSEKRGKQGCLRRVFVSLC